MFWRTFAVCCSVSSPRAGFIGPCSHDDLHDLHASPDGSPGLEPPQRLCRLPGHRMEIITPKEYVGSLIELSQERRGDFVDMKYMTEARTTLVYEMPLAEVHS